MATALVLATALGCGDEHDTRASARAQATWIPVGPGGGRIRSLAVDPGAREALYAGTTGGGIFRSSDRGKTWTNLGLTDLDVFAIVVDPLQPATIYAAGVQGNPGPSLRGVFKSTDAGRTWLRSDTGLAPEGSTGGSDVFALALDPRDPATLYAGTSFTGVFKSTDGGATWHTTGLRDTQVVAALAVDPKTASTVYAATVFEGVFKSVDAGDTWEPASVGLSSPAFPGLPLLPLNTILVDPRRPATLYAGTSRAGVYRSENGAATWEPTAATGFPHVAALALDRQSGTLFASAGTLFCEGRQCDGGVFRSGDAGATWVSATTGLADLRVNALVTDPHASGTVYAGTERMGVFQSSDAGTAWMPSTCGLAAHSMRAVVLDPATPSIVYAVADGTPFKSTDAGTTWRTIDAGLELTRVLTIASGGSTLWAGTHEGFHADGTAGLYMSRDGGASWHRVDAVGRGVLALAVDPRDSNVIYASTFPVSLPDDDVGGEILKTIDCGEHWTTLLGFDDADESVVAFAIDPTAPATVYAATYTSGVLKSVDAGLTWRDRNTGLEFGCCDPSVASLAIDPARPDTLYAGNRHGVFTSLDGGATWTATAHLRPQPHVLVTPQPHVLVAPQVLVSSLAIDPVRGIVFAGTGGDAYGVSDGAGKGVFRSANGGASWEDAGGGLPGGGVEALALDPESARLYAGTSAGSVYVLDVR